MSHISIFDCLSLLRRLQTGWAISSGRPGTFPDSADVIVPHFFHPVNLKSAIRCEKSPPPLWGAASARCTVRPQRTVLPTIQRVYLQDSRHNFFSPVHIRRTAVNCVLSLQVLLFRLFLSFFLFLLFRPLFSPPASFSAKLDIMAGKIFHYTELYTLSTWFSTFHFLSYCNRFLRLWKNFPRPQPGISLSPDSSSLFT